MFAHGACSARSQWTRALNCATRLSTLCTDLLSLSELQAECPQVKHPSSFRPTGQSCTNSAVYTTPPAPPNCTIPATSDIYVPSGDASYNATRDALIAFKTALGNPAALSSWQAGGFPCAWPGWIGVSCNSDAVVSGLFLQDMGLTGALPSAITQLTGLESLVLKVRTYVGDGRLQDTGSVSGLIGLWLQCTAECLGCGA